MMRRRPHRSHSRTGSPFKVSNWFQYQSFQVPASRVPGTPYVLETLICSVYGLVNGGGQATWQYDSITVGGIRLFSETFPIPLDSGIYADCIVSECIYVAEIDSVGVPVTAGTAFLQLNEFANVAQPPDFPERILWRRQFAVALGQDGIYNSYDDRHEFVIKTKARMSSRQGLVHRIEMTNPTVNPITAITHQLAGVALKVGLD